LTEKKFRPASAFTLFYFVLKFRCSTTIRPTEV